MSKTKWMNPNYNFYLHKLNWKVFNSSHVKILIKKIPSISHICACSFKNLSACAAASFDGNWAWPPFTHCLLWHIDRPQPEVSCSKYFLINISGRIFLEIEIMKINYVHIKIEDATCCYSHQLHPRFFCFILVFNFYSLK